MSEQLRYDSKNILRFAVVFAIAFALTGLLFISGVIRNGDTRLYDRCMNYRVSSGAKAKNPLVATVDLNDVSIEALGESLDSRTAFADILEVFSEANAASAFDFLFHNEKSGDGAFINAFNGARDTVIAALAVEKSLVNAPYRKLTEAERESLARHIWHIKVIEKGKVPQAGSFLLPFAALLEAAAQIAHVNMEPDADGVYRRVQLLYEWEEGYIPSFALAAAVLNLRIPVENIELKAGEYLALPLSKTEIIRIPIDEKGRMLVPYTETWKGGNKRISFNTVVEAKYDDEVFDRVFSGLNGRIALVAEISTSQKDFGPVSFERLYPLSGVHAEVLSAILDGLEKKAFIGNSGLAYKLLILFLIICAALGCLNIKKDTICHLIFLLALWGFSCLTFLRWQKAAVAPWFAFPATLLFLLWLSGFIIRLYQKFREQLLLRNALSRYFPSALAKRIMAEGKTELVPAYKELTILFSDISGFTKWSSDKSPQDVHQFLNDYLTRMAGIIFAHGGTVDKFMGDGILSFFGDPFETPDHTPQCIKAAIAMQKEITILAEKWKPLVDIDLKVRIGINTGKVIVGNLGSKARIEYTVIGADVNLAQRMESNAPVGGILVTAAVKNAVKDKFNFTERRDVTVKGYAETIEAYVVGKEPLNK